MTARRLRLGAGALLLAGALVLAAPIAASAHVHIDPEQAKAGTAEVGVTFSVPNEEPKTATTTVKIGLPASAGFTTIQPVTITGWKVVVKSGAADGKASSITYTATGDGIADGQTQAFVVQLGPVPDVDSVLMPVIQTYANGDVVRWADATPASGEEPEHPAPTLYVKATPPVDHDTDDDAAEAESHGSGTASASETPAASSTQAVTDSSTLPIGLSAAALVVALGALAAALVALLRRRR